MFNWLTIVLQKMSDLDELDYTEDAEQYSTGSLSPTYDERYSTKSLSPTYDEQFSTKSLSPTYDDQPSTESLSPVLLSVAFKVLGKC